MALNCGIVGLPNVGKSTIFSALTREKADAQNYPFCTIEPNVGIVPVPDARLDKISTLIPTSRVIPAVTEFVDIAGLVRGASKGEGLGNKFLANIRETGIIAHVVRCFDNADIIHVAGKVDPAGDIDTINIELCLADLETVQKRYDKVSKLARVAHKSEDLAAVPVLEKLLSALGDGIPARKALTTQEELEIVRDLFLITLKPVIYVCNIDEDAIGSGNKYVETVREIASRENASVVPICGKLESDIAEIDDPAEREVFLQDMGLSDSGLNTLIKTSYTTLGLRTFFTAGSDEDRAWTFKAGDKAPQAAGVIHSDFEKGFIRAEVYSFDDLVKYGSEQKVKEAGRLRVEGKDYEVQDGDIMHFRFNV